MTFVDHPACHTPSCLISPGFPHLLSSLQQPVISNHLSCLVVTKVMSALSLNSALVRVSRHSQCFTLAYEIVMKPWLDSTHMKTIIPSPLADRHMLLANHPYWLGWLAWWTELLCVTWVMVLLQSLIPSQMLLPFREREKLPPAPPPSSLPPQPKVSGRAPSVLHTGFSHSSMLFLVSL